MADDKFVVIFIRQSLAKDLARPWTQEEIEAWLAEEDCDGDDEDGLDG